MKIEKVGTRGLLFSFEEPFFTNVYVIVGNTHVFVIDTFLGPDSMKALLDRLREEDIEDKEIIVFNTHADYDHIWGNCFFQNSVVIGHELTREHIIKTGEAALKEYGSEAKGHVELMPPSITFSQHLNYPDEDVQFFHSPGHTKDSSSCYDIKDGVLIVGDNIESPIPYVNEIDIDEYLATLGEYLNFRAKIIVPGHDPVLQTEDMIRSNMDYLLKFRTWDIEISSMDTGERTIHLTNLINLTEYLQRGKLSQDAELHYRQALETLAQLEKTEFTRNGVKKIKRILNHINR